MCGCRREECWIRFLDGCSQATALLQQDHSLHIPVRIRRLDLLTPLPPLLFRCLSLLLLSSLVLHSNRCAGFDGRVCQVTPRRHKRCLLIVKNQQHCWHSDRELNPGLMGESPASYRLAQLGEDAMRHQRGHVSTYADTVKCAVMRHRTMQLFQKTNLRF